MIPALGIRLNKHDAQCDRAAIYMDSTPIAARPEGLHDSDWDKLCRYLCGVAPVVDRLVFNAPLQDDPEAWARLALKMRREEI